MLKYVAVNYCGNRNNRDREKNARYARDLFTGENRQNDRERMQMNASAYNSRICHIIVDEPQEDKKDSNI